MPKLSDIFLSLLGDSLMGAGGLNPAEERRKQEESRQNQNFGQQALDNQRLTALASLNKDFTTTPIPQTGKPTDLNSLVSEMPKAPEGATTMNIPGQGMSYVMPRPQFDVVPQYSPDGKFTGQYMHIERPKGGKTTAYRPPSANSERPRQTPYTDENGVPLLLGSNGSLTPATLPGGGKAVPFRGDESAVSDANLIAQQTPNVDKLFDAYATKSGPMGRIQATGVGGVLDPATKQLEDSLKLTAFTFGGKNLTGQEKEVVFGALFPSWKDNDASREQKRTLLKDFFAGKIDLLQAANLLGSAGGKLRGILQSNQGGGQRPINRAPAQSPGASTLGSVIRVRNKQTGQTGSIPEANFDPNKYDQL